MIRKTIKTLFLTGAVLGGTGFLMFGTDLGSYLGTMAASVKEGVEDQIPIDFELRRAEGLIREIDPQIRNCKRDLARAEVDLEELQGSVRALDKVVIDEERQLKRGASLLTGEAVNASNVSFVLADDRGTRRRVERNLQRTMDSYHNNMAILQTKRALIERQTEAVEVAKQRLMSVRAEKENLADQVQALRTQKQMIETLAAGQQRFHLDDSALSQAKEALNKVKKRLDIAQKMLENEVLWHGDPAIAEDTDPTRDVVKEIHEHFGGSATGASTPTTVEHAVTMR